jgi:hypothetical protein
MCRDIHRHWKRCDHRDYIQAPFCGDFRRGMSQVNNPYYLNQPGIPYHQTERCRQQTRYENSNIYCTPCSMTQQGWNFRGYASGFGGYPRYFGRIVRRRDGGEKEEGKKWYIVLGTSPELNLTLHQVNRRQEGISMRVWNFGRALLLFLLSCFFIRLRTAAHYHQIHCLSTSKALFLHLRFQGFKSIPYPHNHELSYTPSVKPIPCPDID